MCPNRIKLSVRRQENHENLNKIDVLNMSLVRDFSVRRHFSHALPSSDLAGPFYRFYQSPSWGALR